MTYNIDLRGTETLGSLQQNANRHRDWRDNVNWVFGNDPVAIDWTTREIDPNGRVVVTPFDVTIGRSQPELQLAYEKYRRSTLQNSDEYRGLRRLNPGQKIQIGVDDDLATLGTRLQKETKYKEDSSALRNQILAIDGGSTKLAGLGDRPTIEALSGALNTLQEAAIQKERGRPGGADDQWSRQVGADNRLATAQENANTLATRQQEQLEYQFDQNQRERAHNAEMARLDRKSERSDKKELFALQMQQNNLDRAYMRERDEREDARADRDKRTAMLMQMVQGLSKLGYGMAI